MRRFARIGLCVLLVLPAAAGAQSERQTPAVAVGNPVAGFGATDEVELETLLWVARPVVVFADSPNDPRFLQQMELLEERLPELKERDVVVLTDTDPSARGPLRQELRPRGFGLVLIDKDGSVARRSPDPTTARELINLIDRMPSRRQETGSRRN